MKKIQCAECLEYFNADELLHCADCGKCYCERCARRQGICECAGDLTYFD